MNHNEEAVLVPGCECGYAEALRTLKGFEYRLITRVFSEEYARILRTKDLQKHLRLQAKRYGLSGNEATLELRKNLLELRNEIVRAETGLAGKGCDILGDESCSIEGENPDSGSNFKVKIDGEAIEKSLKVFLGLLYEQAILCQTERELEKLR